jgi:hypothetical protein
MACSADSLSNTNLYPGFSRLGVKTTMAKAVLAEWQQMFDWDHIAIVSGIQQSI